MTLDPYLDLEHGVLKNRLGITDPDELRDAEGAATALRLSQLIRRPLPGGYDLGHLQAFHWHLFSDVYSWSGQLRTVAIGRGHLFCPPEQLETTGRDIFTRLAEADYLRGLDRDAFVDKLTGYLAEVNSLHPFRDGNGRTQRIFFRQLAGDAGWLLNWALLDADTNTAASREAHRGDTSLLQAMLDGLVTRRR